MGITYRTDDDLAFLQYCREDDIRNLATYLMFDKDGEKRRASEIANEPAFLALRGQPDQWRRCWQLVAGELQHFGGDSIINLFRRQGVLYKEILCDVCDKTDVKYDGKASAYAIENQLIERLVEKCWEQMSDEQRRKAADEMNMTGALGAIPLVAIVNAIRAGGLGSLQWSSWLAKSASAYFTSSLSATLGGAAALVGGRAVAAIAGPLAAIAVTIPLLSGTAYRVTIPAVIQIAFMRRQYEKEDLF
ncbi:DUF3944 domain-containing protein [Pseudomonas monteilii]|uniref:DUF3944 domain-containing protein n=1 Tax=Pseudomonas monteilii TaxID=76759 RepID=UPI003F6DE627